MMVSITNLKHRLERRNEQGEWIALPR